jgi:hypothetical protein
LLILEVKEDGEALESLERALDYLLRMLESMDSTMVSRNIY